MVNRYLDDAYFRINRNGVVKNICFTDLTEEEQNKMLENRSAEWYKSLCKILAWNLREIGDDYQIYRDEDRFATLSEEEL